MKKIITLKDKDIFPDFISDEDISYELRTAVKVILFDKNNKLALVGHHNYKLLPGGGVEEGESLNEACVREIREEVGYDIEEIKEITITEEFRAKIKRHQETHFFTAQVVGEKGSPQSKQEDEQGLETIWLNLDETTFLLEEGIKNISFKSYHTCFNVRTQLAVLKEFKNCLKEKLSLISPYEVSKKYKNSYDEAILAMRDLGEEPVEKAIVSFSQFWLVDDEKYLGLLQLRHLPAGRFKGLESHIHYSINPKERGKGYGIKILELGLKEAQSLGLKEVIITAKEENEASIKIIESNGGKLIDTVTVQGDLERITICKYKFEL